MKSELLTKLNKQQLSAVTHDSGPLLVIAGPGSGKTRVIVHRVAFLITEEKVKPEEIMVVTFTNKASRELKERLNELLGQSVAERIISGTFHSIASKILRINGMNFIMCLMLANIHINAPRCVYIFYVKTNLKDFLWYS